MKNNHAENIKKSIDVILGTDTILKKVKKTTNDVKRDLFCKIIELIIIAEERSIVMAEKYHTDLSSHNVIFFKIIETFFEFNFSPYKHRMIQFYIYERYTPEGEISSLLDHNKNPVPLNTHEDLWNLLKMMK